MTEHVSSSSNPFGTSSYGSDNAITVHDTDGDDDVDLLVRWSTSITYYQNDGSNTFSTVGGTSNPVNNITIGNSNPVFFVDVDDDGDEDMMVSSGTNIDSYEKTTNSTQPFTAFSSNPFSSITLSSGANDLSIIDVDLDGELDVLVGSQSSGLKYFSKGTNTAYSQITGTDNPFNALASENVAPLLYDFDRDGYLDLLTSTNSGELKYYKGS